jgi:hypothetical protein
MERTDSYRDSLNKELRAVVDSLQVSELHKSYLKSRWLDQVLWMEGKAQQNSYRHHALRVVTLICGLIIPVLAGLSLDAALSTFTKYSIVVLGLVVAISTGLEELFQFGTKWRHYRQTVEGLKIEGWRFFQLADRYRRFASHAEAYPSFADRIEDIFHSDTQVYIAEVVARDRAAEDGKNASELIRPRPN